MRELCHFDIVQPCQRMNCGPFDSAHVFLHLVIDWRLSYTEMNGVIILFDKGVPVHYASLNMVCFFYLYIPLWLSWLHWRRCARCDSICTRCLQVSGVWKGRLQQEQCLQQMRDYLHWSTWRTLLDCWVLGCLTVHQYIQDNKNLRDMTPPFMIFVSWTQYTQEFAWNA